MSVERGCGPEPTSTRGSQAPRGDGRRVARDRHVKRSAETWTRRRLGERWFSTTLGLRDDALEEVRLIASQCAPAHAHVEA